MLRWLTPDAVYESLFEVDLEDLKARGIRGLIIDLDNTLIAFGHGQVTEQARRWVAEARAMGFRLCLTSNALSGRVRYFAQMLDMPGVAIAIKPARRAFRRALRLLETKPEETAVIGDQLFTDVLGGKLMNLYTVLVNPLSTAELGTTRLIRRLERRVLRRLVREGRLAHGEAVARRRAGEQV
jgi:HAD superfamily (subfamily IIIA) phosphatase, TIGR01668